MIKIKPNINDLIIGIIISVVFILLSFKDFGLFESVEQFLYSVEMRFALASPNGANKIAMVNIDKKSIEELGPNFGAWPWPRSAIARMIEKINSGGARLIGLDLEGLDQREQNQGLTEIKKLHSELDSLELTQDERIILKKRLSEIELKLDNDSALYMAIKKSGNVILPAKGIISETEPVFNENDTSIINRTRLTSNVPFSDSFHEFNNILIPFPEIASNCFGIGHINLSQEKSMSGRSHLLYFNLGNNFKNNFIPSMALKLALEYIGEERGGLTFHEGNIEFANKTIPATKGEVLIRFLGGGRSFPYYSFATIYNLEDIPPALFEEKIVLIGYTADSGSRINTPVDIDMSRVEFLANVVQALLSEESFIKRPGVMIYFEAVVLLILITCFSNILPRNSQINRLLIVLSICVIVIISGVISFTIMNVWFKTVYILAGLIVLYLTLLIRDIIINQKMMGIQSKEFKESNRMLGLSFQSQGLLDLAFEKFRKCDLDSSMKDVIYNLGLDYERKRMINKAISVYEYIAHKDSDFRDLHSRIPKLRSAIGATVVPPIKGKKEEKILVVNDLEIKPTVGRYEIIREIGQGAMGVVYEAKDPKINRRIAIKTIRFSDEFEKDHVQEVKNRFFREAEIAGKLSHPSIVSIYDAGEDYDLTYLAMEFLEGKDLREYCKKGNLKSLRRVLHIVNEVALALDHAHSKGVIHRDIKPGNIMLLKTGKVVVTDFGIAKAISSAATKSGVVLGTPNYMSPEQVNGQNIDGRSDLFSLGIVMFEMLAGQLPFHGTNITNLLYKITQEKHPSIRSINPKIPKVCERIIDKALEKDTAKRFQSGNEMATYLKAVLNRIDTVKKNKND